MPACVAITISSIACSPPAITPFTSPRRSDANGSFSFHSGCWGASACTRSRAKNSWKYIGCSTQSVPSLSKTAMRSAGGTKSGEPFFVTFATNSMIVAFAGPSSHDESGSDSACAGVTTYQGAHRTAASTHLLILCRLMAIHPHEGHHNSLMQGGLVMDDLGRIAPRVASLTVAGNGIVRVSQFDEDLDGLAVLRRFDCGDVDRPG